VPGAARADDASSPSALPSTFCLTAPAQELRHHVDALASGLHERGFCQGDVLGVFSPNHVEYAIALLAAVRLGTPTMRHTVGRPVV